MSENLHSYFGFRNIVKNPFLEDKLGLSYNFSLCKEHLRCHTKCNAHLVVNMPRRILIYATKGSKKQ